MTAPAAWGAEVDLDRAIGELARRGDVEIPPYPAVALRIERLVAGGDFGLDELGRIVQADQALAADVLRCANSAAYARGEPVASLPQAVARIGAGELSRIALASALGGRALARGPLASLRRRAWHEAIAAAVLARDLARSRGLPAEDAFACGLLHDFGRVLAVECLERLASGARTARPMPARFWEAVVDRQHLALGALIGERWELPAVLVEAITRHHEEAPAGARAPGLLRILALVDRLVHLLEDRSAVSLADVMAVQSLPDAEAAAVLRAVEAVPELVLAFERVAPAGDRSLVAPPARPAARAPGEPLRLRVGDASYDVTGFARDQLIARGSAPLLEGALLEVELSGPAPTRFHARVLVSWEDARGRWGVVLMPFALGGAALLRWHGLAGVAEG